MYTSSPVSVFVPLDLAMPRSWAVVEPVLSDTLIVEPLVVRTKCPSSTLATTSIPALLNASSTSLTVTARDRSMSTAVPPSMLTSTTPRLMPLPPFRAASSMSRSRRALSDSKVNDDAPTALLSVSAKPLLSN